MRKISKKLNLSKAYKQWLKEHERDGKDHPEYESSSFEHYWCVAMNLFHCQDGLCAYTEIKLASEEYYKSSNWTSENVYQNPFHPEKIQVNGQLEHFDTTLKPKQAWLWSNLFMADSDVNTKIKKSQNVDYILKPDESTYDENKYLAYSRSQHIFFANPKLSDAKQKRVNKMIQVLGINYRPIIDQRRMYVENILKTVEIGLEKLEDIKIEQFPTALKMIKQNGL